MQEDLGGFSKPACANDISFFGCGTSKDATSCKSPIFRGHFGTVERTTDSNSFAKGGQVESMMRCCVQRRCEPPWDNYFCKNTYKTIMPSGFHV